MTRTTPRRKIEIHVLKNYPYSNLNRDEFGTPKSCVFAGKPHGRISSQSLKRSWREYFRARFNPEDVSIRTRQLPGMVKDYLIAEGKDEEYVNAAVKELKKLFVSEKSDSNKENKKDTETSTGQIVPLAPAEILFFKEEFAGVDDIKHFDAKSFKERFAALGSAVDIALWGRMVTSSVVKSSEAAMQVAHAISTNELQIEQDFFAAVDDMMQGEGAAIIDNAEYNSCCYYMYGCVDFDLLVENLGGDEAKARELMPMLLEAIAYANPSGKNTTTGTNILPSAMMVEAKEVPYNLVNAFSKPCSTGGEGLVINSEKALAGHCERMAHKFGIEARRVWFSTEDVTCTCAENAETLPELFTKAASFI